MDEGTKAKFRCFFWAWRSGSIGSIVVIVQILIFFVARGICDLTNSLHFVPLGMQCVSLSFSLSFPLGVTWRGYRMIGRLHFTRRRRRRQGRRPSYFMQFNSLIIFFEFPLHPFSLSFLLRPLFIASRPFRGLRMRNRLGTNRSLQPNAQKSANVNTKFQESDVEHFLFRLKLFLCVSCSSARDAKCFHAKRAGAAHKSTEPGRFNSTGQVLEIYGTETIEESSGRRRRRLAGRKKVKCNLLVCASGLNACRHHNLSSVCVIFFSRKMLFREQIALLCHQLFVS